MVSSLIDICNYNFDILKKMEKSAKNVVKVQFSVIQKQRQKMSSAMQEGYDIYFQIKPENGEKYWIPNSCCSTCAIILRSVYRGDFDHLFRFTSPTS